ncbi:MAG: hypothetical protein PHU21_12960, partial [Elusimicrobia bacterium]|nr:hypothetical protein [Elusimicrobiota bacterium]
MRPLKTRAANLVAWTLYAAALAGCGGSKLVMTGPATPPAEPVGLMVVDASEPSFGRELSQQLASHGYSMLDNSKTASLLSRLGRSGYPVEEPESMAALKSCLVDAVLTVRSDAASSVGFGGGSLLDKVKLRVLKTSSGEAIAGMDWTNSWGGMPGSPADGMMRKSAAAAARELAAALAARLGQPGPRSALKCPERSFAVASRARPAAAPRVSSDVDTPRYTSQPRPDDFAIVVGIENYSRLPAASHA